MQMSEISCGLVLNDLIDRHINWSLTARRLQEGLHPANTQPGVVPGLPLEIPILRSNEGGGVVDSVTALIQQDQGFCGSSLRRRLGRNCARWLRRGGSLLCGSRCRPSCCVALCSC